jgi:AcrR family transcriptional regulator
MDDTVVDRSDHSNRGNRGDRGERGDRRKRRTRKLALDAFAALLFERGYAAVTVAAVAERAAIGRSTLYEHFRTKDELLDAAVDLRLALLAADTPDMAGLEALALHVRAHAGAVRLLLTQPLRSRIARVLALRLGARLRLRGTPAPLAELRAVAVAEGRLAVLALWLHNVGYVSALAPRAVAEELARVVVD